jgi:hypothetical protein
MQQSTISENVQNIQHLLSQFVKLSRRPSLVPQGVTTESVDVDSSESAAPWSWTAAEAAITEAALLPFLIHLAASRDDIDSLNYCLKPTIVHDSAESLKHGLIPGGIVNCLEAGSGRSPLHVASLNGHVRSVELLLRSGALVHLRDTLGHTALYFVSRFTFLQLNTHEWSEIRLHDKGMKTLSTYLHLLVRRLVAKMKTLPIALRRKLLRQEIRFPCVYGRRLDGAMDHELTDNYCLLQPKERSSEWISHDEV